jgi:hypothetical protein
MTRSEFDIPIQYGVSWSEDSPSLPKRKELETDLLNAITLCAEAFGATEIEVKSVVDAPDKTGKVVTLSADGNLDLEALQNSLRRAVNGFE